MRDELRELVEKRFKAKADAPAVWGGFLGNPQCAVAVPDRPNYVYVTMGDGTVVEAYNKVAPTILNLPVTVGFDPSQEKANLLEVLSVRNIPRYGASENAYHVDAHHASHEWMNYNGNTDVVYMQLRQFMPLRPTLVPHTASTPFQIYIQPAMQLIGNQWQQVGGSTISLLDYGTNPQTVISGSGAHAKYVLISMSAVTGSLVISSGSTKTIGTLALSDIPATPANHIPICAVRRYDLQPKILESRLTTDLVDLRWGMPLNGLILPSSTSPGAGFYLTGYNAVSGSFSSGSVAANHNAMSGLQGGQVNEYYHLTNAQHTAVVYTDETQTLTNKTLVSPIVAILKPASDSTNAIQITQASSGSPIMVFDTTNKLVGIGTTPTAKLHVVGQSDVVQILGQAYSGQTANLFELKTSGGSLTVGVDANGNVVIGTGKTTSVNNKLYLYMLNIDSSASKKGVNVDFYSQALTAADTNAHQGVLINFYAYGNYNHTGAQSAIAPAAYASSGSGTCTTLAAISSTIGTLSNGVITSAYCIRANVYSPGTGVITSLYGFESNYYAASAVSMYGVIIKANTTGTGTSKYGLYIESVSGAASNNYAILTKAGKVSFNDGNEAEADFYCKTDNYSAIFIDTSNDSIVLMSSASGKIGFYGATAIVRPTTSGSSASFTENSGTAVNTESTFDGYTIAQVVKAMRDIGLLS